MTTNSSWSIDDKRINFQFGCEQAWRIEHGKLATLFKNPNYTGITPEFWGSCDAVGGAEDWVVGHANCGKGQPGQVGRVGHEASPARFRNVQVGYVVSDVLGPDEFRRIADGALSLVGADDVEVLLMHEWGAHALREIPVHQSIAREDTGLRVRVVKGGHSVWPPRTRRPRGATAAARSALEMAEVVAVDPLWPGLAPPEAVPEVDHSSRARPQPPRNARRGGRGADRRCPLRLHGRQLTRRSRSSSASRTAEGSSAGLRPPRHRSPRS